MCRAHFRISLAVIVQLTIKPLLLSITNINEILLIFTLYKVFINDELDFTYPTCLKIFKFIYILTYVINP